MTTAPVESVTFDGGRGLLAGPAGDGPHPAVLILHELLGLNDDMADKAARFAEAGYVALAADFLGDGFQLGCIARAVRDVRRGHGPTLDRVETARSWLAERDDVDADRIGVVGFCMGGGFAVLHAADRDLGAVGTFYGDVPDDAERLEGIPPCFAGYGERDRLFGPNAARLRGHLERLDVAHEVVTYPDAGHSYMSDTGHWMARVGRRGPMKVDFDPAAAEDSWTRMLAFFDHHLRR